MPTTQDDSLLAFKAWLTWRRIQAENGMDKDELEAIRNVERLLEKYEVEQSNPMFKR